MTNEEIISGFLKTPAEGGAYTDERLAALLAHAEDGKLSFGSCCCLIGIPTADHALRGHTSDFENYLDPHYFVSKYGLPGFSAAVLDAKALPGIEAVETAFLNLSRLAPGRRRSPEEDVERRAKLIPLIKAEMRRRESLRAQAEVSELIAV